MVTRYLNEKMGKSYLNRDDFNDRPVKTRPAQPTPSHSVPSSARDEQAIPKVPRETAPRETARSAPPVLSHQQREAQSALFRHACDWLALHHLCGNTRCRRARACRGEAVACLRAGLPQVPESARQFVRSMIEGNELHFDFDTAFADAEEFAESWAGWIAGLQAASKAGNRVKRAQNPALTKR